MLHLTGKLLSILNMDERTLNDGRVIPARVQVQVQTEEVLDDGQIRIGLQTITVPDAKTVKGRIGEAVSVPVRAYAAGRDVRFIYNAMPAPAASQAVA